MAKWWLPDVVVSVDEWPHSATGKVFKLKLRELFGDYELPATATWPCLNRLDGVRRCAVMVPVRDDRAGLAVKCVEESTCGDKDLTC